MKEQFMKRAIDLAKLGVGFVNPNPKVGAVVVKDNRIIGEGYHECFGGSHAEVNAIYSCRESMEGATLYVTLEPCNHQGKTPPCVTHIMEVGISQVIIGMLDPNPLMAGKSVEILKNQGIKVEVGILEGACRGLNPYFIKGMTEKRPYLVMKSALSLDGQISSSHGQRSQISCDVSKATVHEMRNDMMGIMVGIGTVLTDDPKLNCRLNRTCISPRPIIVDSKGRLPLDSNLFEYHSSKDVILATTDQLSDDCHQAFLERAVTVIKCKTKRGQVDLGDLMEKLYSLGLDSILLEGGSRLNAEALKSGIVDEIVTFIAPKILGMGVPYLEGLEEAVALKLLDVSKSGEDIRVKWQVRD